MWHENYTHKLTEPTAVSILRNNALGSTEEITVVAEEFYFLGSREGDWLCGKPKNIRFEPNDRIVLPNGHECTTTELPDKFASSGLLIAKPISREPLDRRPFVFNRFFDRNLFWILLIIIVFASAIGSI